MGLLMMIETLQNSARGYYSFTVNISLTWKRQLQYEREKEREGEGDGEKGRDGE